MSHNPAVVPILAILVILWYLQVSLVTLPRSSPPVLNMIRFPDRDPTGFCNWEPEPDRLDSEKKINRIRYGYPNCIGHCSKMLNQSFF